MKIYYIDSVDIDHLFGTGGAPLFKSALQKKSDLFYFVGLSEKREIGKYIKTQLFNKVVDFFAVSQGIRTLMPRNIVFALNVLLNWKKIKSIDKQANVIFIRSYTILWLFTYIIKGYKVIFYAPGLGNPMEIGRFTKLSFLGKIYEWIHFNSLTKASILMAAASMKDVENANKLLSKYKSKVYFSQVPESVDPSYFAPKDKNLAFSQLKLEINRDQDTIIFSFIGRIAKVKGLPLLIDSFTLFNSHEPNSFLIIAGAGELMKETINYVKQKHIENNVIFIGNQNTDNIVNLINISNACLFGSYTEGFSFAMLEILSTGKPIVTTNVSGTDELIIEGITGFVVENRDISRYYQAMLKVLKIQNCELNCRNLVLNNYTNNHQWSRILELLK